MSADDETYYRYLANRSRLQYLARRPFMRSLAACFTGRVLDVGCGLGEFARYYPGEYSGIDPNPCCVEHLIARGLDCRLGFAESIQHPDESFDGVLLSHVLEHLEQPGEAIDEMHRVLKPGGRLVVVVPMAAGFRKDPTHKVYYTAQVLDPLLAAHGFAIHHTWTYPFGAALLSRALYFYELRTLAVRQA